MNLKPPDRSQPESVFPHQLQPKFREKPPPQTKAEAQFQNPLQPKQQSPRVPFKFLTRNLTISDNTQSACQQVRIKRVYLKNLIDKRIPLKGGDFMEYHQFNNKKHVKTLKKLQITSTDHQTHEIFKACRKLKTFRVNDYHPNMVNVALIIKKLPTKVQSLSVELTRVYSVKLIFSILKSLRRLLNLQSFYKEFRLRTRMDAEKELNIYNKSVSRLKRMKRACYGYYERDQLSFRTTMEKGVMQPSINGLEVAISTYYLARSELKGYCEPFFRFKVFPNLKSLKILLQFCDSPLNDFVVKAFSDLQILQELDIHVEKCRLKTHYIFKGLLKLPPLKRFSLSLDGIGEKDWSLLKKFAKKQTILESFRFKLLPSSPAFPNDPKRHIKELIENLHHQTLKSLELKSIKWSPCGFAEGFKFFVLPDQLHTLKIEANMKLEFMETRNQIYALWKSLQNQSGSLQHLQLSFSEISRRSLFDDIFSTVSKLVNLKDLELSIKMCQEMFSTKEVKEMLSQKKIPQYDFDLGNLSQLQNLETFSFNFDEGENDPQKPKEGWLLQMLIAFRHLDKLQKVHIRILSEKIQQELKKTQEKIVAAVLQLRDTCIREIEFDMKFDFGLTALKTAMKEVNQRQSTKCKFMF